MRGRGKEGLAKTLVLEAEEEAVGRERESIAGWAESLTHRARQSTLPTELNTHCDVSLRNRRRHIAHRLITRTDATVTMATSICDVIGRSFTGKQIPDVASLCPSLSLPVVFVSEGRSVRVKSLLYEMSV